MASFKSIQRNKQRRRNRCKKTSRFHANRLRLVVHRSLRYFEAQIIDDAKGLTLVSSSSRDKDFKNELKNVENKTEISSLVGKSIAFKAKKSKIGNLVFDRNGYPYHGRVRAFVDSARKNGLKL